MRSTSTAGADGRRRSIGCRRDGDGYIVDAGDRRFEADHVVVAMATYQAPRVPEFARALDPGIVQLHSSEYKNPAQLRPGDVLLVGAGNSGADIAIDVARSHRDVAVRAASGPRAVPDRQPHCARPPADRLPGRLSSDPHGGHADGTARAAGGHLEGRAAHPCEARRTSVAAGVQRAPRMTGVRNGKPLLADGQRPRRRQRDLVHGVPPRLLVDRPADARLPRRTASRCTSAASYPANRAVLRRAPLPVRVLFDDDSRYRAGCRANRRHHPAPGRSGADRHRSGGHQHGRVKHRRSWPALRPRSPKVGCTSGFER